MRILQISSATNFGGGEKHFVDLCRGLAEKGHDVFVCVRPNAVWLKQLSFLPPQNFFYLPLRNSLDVFSALKLAGIIRAEKIEIVHAHLARDYPAASFAIRFSKNAKLVLTRHIFFPLNSLLKRILPRTAIFIAPTETGRQKLLKQNLVLPEQIHRIYNGIDVAHFTASPNFNRADLCKQLNLPNDKRFVGIAGEITAHKGQLDFVRAASLTAKKFPDVEFLIIGQDSSVHQNHQFELEQLIAELKLEKKIHLLGFWEDVAPLYKLLEVFISASHVEPFGLVIAEASASGCPVVATATSGAREIIIDGETGKLVPIKNIAALAQAVDDFLSDEESRKAFAEKARLRIAGCFDLERMIVQTERLYENLRRENSG